MHDPVHVYMIGHTTLSSIGTHTYMWKQTITLWIEPAKETITLWIEPAKETITLWIEPAKETILCCLKSDSNPQSLLIRLTNWATIWGSHSWLDCNQILLLTNKCIRYVICLLLYLYSIVHTQLNRYSQVWHYAGSYTYIMFVHIVSHIHVHRHYNVHSKFTLQVSTYIRPCTIWNGFTRNVRLTN